MQRTHGWRGNPWNPCTHLPAPTSSTSQPVFPPPANAPAAVAENTCSFNTDYTPTRCVAALLAPALMSRQTPLCCLSLWMFFQLILYKSYSINWVRSHVSILHHSEWNRALQTNGWLGVWKCIKQPWNISANKSILSKKEGKKGSFQRPLESCNKGPRGQK